MKERNKSISEDSFELLILQVCSLYMYLNFGIPNRHFRTVGHTCTLYMF